MPYRVIRVGFGFLGVLILAAVYFLAISVSLAMDAAHLPQFLVLNIPPEQYYAYERFFILSVVPAVKEVERLSWGKSIALALMGFLVNGVVQFIFVR